MSSIGGISLYLCLALTLVAAIWDIRTRRIPNWLNAAIAVTAIVAAFATGSFTALGLNALHALVALIIGMALFAAGMIGAGDAKMYSSAAFAIAPAKALTMLGWTSVIGLVVLIGMYVGKRIAGIPIKKDGKSFTLPYGVPIAAGFWLTILL